MPVFSDCSLAWQIISPSKLHLILPSVYLYGPLTHSKPKSSNSIPIMPPNHQTIYMIFFPSLFPAGNIAQYSR